MAGTMELRQLVILAIALAAIAFVIAMTIYFKCFYNPAPRFRRRRPGAHRGYRLYQMPPIGERTPALNYGNQPSEYLTTSQVYRLLPGLKQLEEARDEGLPPLVENSVSAV